jgi:hypothetical protein
MTSPGDGGLTGAAPRTMDVNSWEDFLTQLARLRSARQSAGVNDTFLYRGLSDSIWPLDTSLERFGRRDCRILAYMESILRISSQVESLTDRQWLLPTFPEVQRVLASPTFWDVEFPGKASSYLVYLRHHGFPSPLLDWTRSENVAAFFAFRAAAIPADGKVSVFVFSESPNQMRMKSGDLGPAIRTLGPYIRTHKRHFLQQSDYTICACFEPCPTFVAHQCVFDTHEPSQDLLWKFNLPWSERTRVLKILDSYNLNAFSLFDSEESLMETMATRELYSAT